MKWTALLFASLPLVVCSGCGTPVRDDVSPRNAKPITGPMVWMTPPVDWDVPPRLLRGDEPIYPVSRLIANQSGAATLEYVIDEKGVPTEIRIVSATHKYFGFHSVIALRTWRFSPAIKDGKPVKARVTQTFKFDIK